MVYIYTSVFSVNIFPYLITCWIRFLCFFSFLFSFFNIGFGIVSDDVCHLWFKAEMWKNWFFSSSSILHNKVPVLQRCSLKLHFSQVSPLGWWKLPYLLKCNFIIFNMRQKIWSDEVNIMRLSLKNEVRTFCCWKSLTFCDQ